LLIDGFLNYTNSRARGNKKYARSGCRIVYIAPVKIGSGKYDAHSQSQNGSISQNRRIGKKLNGQIVKKMDIFRTTLSLGRTR
jgi:hypothetical protein